MEREKKQHSSDVENDLEIVDSLDMTFSEETKLPIPEKSFYQELLEKPIPLENRINHLIPYVEFTAEVFTADALARRIGITDKTWVERVAKKIGIIPEQVLENDKLKTVYMPPALELIDEEWQWANSYKNLADMVSETTVADFIGKSRTWVRHTANDLGVHPEIAARKSNQQVFLYPKSLAAELRHILLVVSPDEDWVTISHLADRIGRSDKWVHDFLSERGIKPEMRLSSLTKRISEHYPPELLEVLERETERYKPGGDWFTLNALARALGKDVDWIKPRLRSMQVDSEDRRDDANKVSKHYPPSVLAELKQEAEKLSRLPAKGDNLTVTDLAAHYQKSTYWVAIRLERIPVTPEARMAKNLKVICTYPPDVIQQIEALPADFRQKNTNKTD